MTGGFPLVPGIDGVGWTESGERVGFLLPEAPFGGMAEKTLVRDALCMPVPDNLSDVLAAAIINPGQSPIGALSARATLQPGEGVLVMAQLVRPVRSPSRSLSTSAPAAWSQPAETPAR